MRRRLNRRTHEMIERSLQLFPELRGTTITVGYTRKHLGSATVIHRQGKLLRLIIRLRARKVTYQTIGHELTHLLQGLAYGGCPAAVDAKKVPAGEAQCDIWTLARHPLFCDDAPTYLRLPRSVRDNWAEYAARVREICIAAIDKRRTHRFYIRWLEGELSRLARTRRFEVSAPGQLRLPLE